MNQGVRVTVVGAGVVGLSCAVRLLEAGHDVAVLARDLPLETTSSVAAALWYPYRALPQDRVAAWAATTYDVLGGLVAEPDTGVALRSGTEVFREPQPDPWWAAAVPDLRRATDLPAPYVDGWGFAAPVVEMPVYLVWLAGRVVDLGRHRSPGWRWPRCRPAATSSSTAPGSGRAGWPRTRPWCRCGARWSWSSRSGSTAGGWTAPVRRTWCRARTTSSWAAPTTRGTGAGPPPRRSATDILARATRLVPELAGARVLRTRVGLRPVRPTVRLEREGRVIHCYGVGGAGVTLSWGVAADVTASGRSFHACGNAVCTSW